MLSKGEYYVYLNQLRAIHKGQKKEIHEGQRRATKRFEKAQDGSGKDREGGKDFHQGR